ncbi:MAG: low-specificity L-threonine aldolase [Candidatus Methanofastidiosia archaeon]
MIDLRSDTLTLPTREMIEAISTSELGDDVFGEDPTVNKLEKIAAKMMGKEKALLVTSGTQANLTSILTHTKKGDEIIVEAESHIYYYECGAAAAFGGIIYRPVKGNMGVFNPKDVENAIRQKNIHMPETTLICMENTHNRASGCVVMPEEIEEIYNIAKNHNLKMHLDGARIFNTSVAARRDVREFTKYFDSVMFCLSKGLSAPIGSVVCGDYEFVERARKTRKMLGGGMRQAGIIAACGLVALEKMVPRLEEDHKNAKILAEGLSTIDGIKIDVERVHTNILVFDVEGLGGSQVFLERLEREGVKAISFGKNLVRMVTYRGVTREDVEATIEIVKRIAKS